jgi:hypothetical protein
MMSARKLRFRVVINIRSTSSTALGHMPGIMAEREAEAVKL